MSLSKPEGEARRVQPGQSSPLVPLWRRNNIYRLDWQTLGLCLENLTKKILASSFSPSTIVGISRGGLVPATSLANSFNIEDFHVMRILRNLNDQLYSQKQDPKIIWSSAKDIVFEGSILVVDDVVGEGKTLSFAVEYLRQKGAKDIRTAAVVEMQNSQFQPDYSALALDDWIVFPWESPDPRMEGKFTLVSDV